MIHEGLSLALCLGVAHAAAQSPGPARLVAVSGYTLSGTVADREGNPIPDAEVALMRHDTASMYVRSDANGKFRVMELPAVPEKVRVRRLGFRPAVVPVPSSRADRTSSVFVTLEPMAAKLGTVHVDDDEDDTPNVNDLRLRGFFERQQANSFGHYITPDALAQMNVQYPSQALRTIPGIDLRPSRRIGNLVRIRGCGVPGESNDTIGPLIWVDGVRMTDAELDEAVQGSDIAAIEVYSSFAGIPAQYFDRSAVCGTILVWTKSR